MNKKATSFLLPLYYVLILSVLVSGYYAHLAYAEDDTFSLLKIGSDQQAIFESYAAADSIQAYAQILAHQSTGHIATWSHGNLNEEAATWFTDHLNNHLLLEHPVRIKAQISSQRVLFESEEPITITLRRTPTQIVAQPTTSVFHGGGDLQVYPVEADGDDIRLTSDFGKRSCSECTSKNHPAIDLRAHENWNIIAPANGIFIEKTSQDKFWINHGRITCGYFHVLLVEGIQPGDQIRAGQHIATSAPQSVSRVTPHLDLRCYLNNDEMTEARALQLFGADRVATYNDASNSLHPYAIKAVSPQGRNTIFLDPFCFMSPGLRNEINLGSFGGNITETCNAYQRAGLFEGVQPENVENFQDQIIAFSIQQWECGPYYRQPVPATGIVCYSNRADDAGGPTRWGITQATLTRWKTAQNIPGEVTAETVSQLTEEEAIQIYETNYFNANHLELLPTELIPHVYDLTVNHGGWHIILQSAAQNMGAQVTFEQARVTETMANTYTGLLAEHGVDAVHNAIADARWEYYQNLDTFEANQGGWRTRTDYYRTSDGSAYAINQFAGNEEIGTYQFMLRVEAPIPEAAATRLQRLREMREDLETCALEDTSCLETLMDLHDATICTDAQAQYQEAQENCASQTQTCGCILPLPAADVIYTTSNVEFHSQEEEVLREGNLFSTADDGDVSTSYIIEFSESENNERSQERADTLTVSSESDRLTSPDNPAIQLSHPGYILAREDTTRGEYVYLSQELNSACTYTLPVQYCNIHGSVWVNHEISSMEE